MNLLKNKKILAIAGLVCLLLGTMFPYYVIKIYGYKETVAVFNYWPGKLIILLIIFNVLVIFKKEIKNIIPKIYEVGVFKKIDEQGPKFSLVPTILSVICIIYLTFDLHVDSSYVKNGLGFYLLWGGTILLVAHAFIYKEKNDEILEPMQSYQTNNAEYQPIEQIKNVNNDVQSEYNVQNQNMDNYASTNIQYNKQNVPYENQMMNSQYNNYSQSNLNDSMNNQTSNYESTVNYGQTYTPYNEQQVVNNINMQYDQNQLMNQPNMNSQPTNLKVCPQCGNRVDSNASNCFMCGYKF